MFDFIVFLICYLVIGYLISLILCIRMATKLLNMGYDIDSIYECVYSVIDDSDVSILNIILGLFIWPIRLSTNIKAVEEELISRLEKAKESE